MTLKTYLISGLLSLFISVVGMAQKASLDETDTQASVKASYLFQFSKYTDWPEDTKKGPFYIAIAGNASLFEILRDKYANKPIGSQLLQIVQVNSPSEVPENVQIIYVDPSESGVLAEYLKKFRKSTSLIITEKNDALDLGAHINFLKTEGIIRFEINDTGSQQKGILFSDKLKGWATKLK
jgi:hypothetical protein